VGARFGEAVTLREEVGTVTAVGAGMNADWSYLRRALGVAEELGARVHAVHTSPLQLTLLVDKQYLKPLTARLHREFLGAP
jgi:aspartate kinase